MKKKKWCLRLSDWSVLVCSSRCWAVLNTCITTSAWSRTSTSTPSHWRDGWWELHSSPSFHLQPDVTHLQQGEKTNERKEEVCCFVQAFCQMSPSSCTFNLYSQHISWSVWCNRNLPPLIFPRWRSSIWTDAGCLSLSAALYSRQLQEQPLPQLPSLFLCHSDDVQHDLPVQPAGKHPDTPEAPIKGPRPTHALQACALIQSC